MAFNLIINSTGSLLAPGIPDLRVRVRIAESASGAPLTGLSASMSPTSFAISYITLGSTAINQITLQNPTGTFGYLSGSFREIGYGFYDVDLPSAAVSASRGGTLVVDGPLVRSAAATYVCNTADPQTLLTSTSVWINATSRSINSGSSGGGGGGSGGGTLTFYHPVGLSTPSIYFTLVGTDGLPARGVTTASLGLTGSYMRERSGTLQFPLAQLTHPTQSYVAGGFIEISQSVIPGLYRLDPPAAITATGSNYVFVALSGSTVQQSIVKVELSSFNAYSSTDSASIAEAVWNTSRGGSRVSGTFGYNIDSQLTTISVNVNSQSIAEQVWNTARGGARISGTFGYNIDSQLTTLAVTVNTASVAEGVWLYASRSINSGSSAATIDSASIAEQVWNTARGGSRVSGTFGYNVDSQLSSLAVGVNTASIAQGVWLYSSRSINSGSITATVDSASLAQGVWGYATRSITDMSTVASTRVANELLDLSNAIESGSTLRGLLRGMAAALMGTSSGSNTPTITFRNAVAGDKVRITATVNATTGNRDAIVFDLT